jgi:acetyl/propionyl-CoA carboxylase alpha subunit
MKYTLIRNDEEQEFEVERTASGELRIRGNEGESLIDVRHLPGGSIHLLHNHLSYDISTTVDGPHVRCMVLGRYYEFEIYNDRELRMMRLEQSSQGAVDPLIMAPMAGRIVVVHVEVGQVVEKGTPLVVIEAMKMENVIKAPHSGTVEALDVVAETAVDNGARLLVLTPPEEAAS